VRWLAALQLRVQAGVVRVYRTANHQAKGKGTATWRGNVAFVVSSNIRGVCDNGKYFYLSVGEGEPKRRTQSG